MTYIFKDEQDVVGPDLRAQWEVAPRVSTRMTATAIRPADHNALFATGLVVAMYVSAALLLVQSYVG